ncbi:MAG: hypothetical protein PHQ03_04685 [Methylococcales bacterium]|nr:hypothetical protein [Methylococcales bacterium]
MKALQKILVSVVFAAMSSSVFAVSNPTYEEVQMAIDNTLNKVQESKTALDNGADTDTVVAMVTDARQLQKDISNNVLDLKRNQASNVLKQARAALLKNEIAEAKNLLGEALGKYKEIKQLYISNHS